MTSTDPEFDLIHDADDGDEPIDDSLLLDAARAGSVGAYGILYARHHAGAVKVARRSLSHAERSLAEDVVEIAFLQVFTALRNGKGPRRQLRRYLSTAVKREAWRTQRRRRSHDDVVDRWAVGEAGAAQAAARVELSDGHELLGEAFRGLSARWRNVLWLTEVEGRSPSEVGTMLGLSAASASSLAYRARQGLVAAYLAAYQRTGAAEACARLTPQLIEYLSAGRPPEGFDDVVAHLEGCPTCRDVLRGVDVLGPRLAAMVPFGLLTSALWASGLGTHADELAGAAVVAGTVVAGIGAAGAASGAGGGAGASSAATGAAAGGGSVGLAGVAGIVAAVVVVVGGVALASGALTGGGSDAAERAAVPASSREAPPSAEGDRAGGTAPGAPSPAPGSAEPATSADDGSAVADEPRLDAAPAPAPDPVPDPPVAAPARPVPPVDRPAPTDPRPAVPSPTTTPPPTRPEVPPTTAPGPPTTVAPTTTTTTEVPAMGRISGRAIWSPLGIDLLATGVEGVEVRALDPRGTTVASDRTDGAGRWSIGPVPAGTYRLVAVVPGSHVPEGEGSGWADGGSWERELGEVTTSGGDAVVSDLRLVPRWVLG